MINERAILAQKVKDYRRKENLTQWDFADECGISRDALSLIEREQSNLTIDTLQLLSARMGITVSELFSNSPITYIVITSTAEIEGEDYKTYGIAAVKNGITLEEIHDISTDLNKVKALSNLCTENNLSPIHLSDIVEDFIS